MNFFQWLQGMWQASSGALFHPSDTMNAITQPDIAPLNPNNFWSPLNQGNPLSPIAPSQIGGTANSMNMDTQTLMMLMLLGGRGGGSSDMLMLMLMMGMMGNGGTQPANIVPIVEQPDTPISSVQGVLFGNTPLRPSGNIPVIAPAISPVPASSIAAPVSMPSGFNPAWWDTLSTSAQQTLSNYYNYGMHYTT